MDTKQKSSTMLIILDGFGYRKEKDYNAIYHAHTPNFDRWMKEFPHAIIKADGPSVGLPEGYIGSSEAGHLTIGAGRVIKEAVTRINEAIKDGSFYKNTVLVNALKKIASTDHTLHIMGLISDAGVHSDIKQLYAFLEAARREGVKNIVLHAFLDGRDMPPQSAGPFLQKVEKEINALGAKIGSIHGRLYAMDRDNNWERTELSYRTLTEPRTQKSISWHEALENSYRNGITDEFLVPMQLEPDSYIKNGDGIIFFNFRPDRAKQLSESFTDPNFKEFKTKPLQLAFFVTPTAYDGSKQVMYPKSPVQTTLKTVLAEHGKSIFSIAETEKYAHVTYFFDGGKKFTLLTEKRVLIPSLHAEKYDQHPEMSAGTITQTVLQSLRETPADFYLINYANADMVGHSGNFGATVKAVAYLDEQLGILYKQVVEKMNGTIYITADHGNAEDMYDETIGQPRTAHTTNDVPFIMLNKKVEGDDKILPLKSLADIAPFILTQMHIPVPKEMVGSGK
jgi:2,3-bisphosphoglycerate-independent phosphoglycerate mutase